jgi:hypothetical protein
MTDIVLVPGGWRGGWTFSSIARDIRARGHEAWTPTLTGLGERVQIACPNALAFGVMPPDNRDSCCVPHPLAAFRQSIHLTGLCDWMERYALYLDLRETEE